MKSVPFVLAALASAAFANTAPTVVIQSAAMRPGTTLMDVVYRVNDPDDATVKTRALAFVDGVRSFANVIKPVTFVEGTAAKLGDAIPSNTNHTLTWDVAADWDVDLGQVKFEVLAMDGRGLLPLDWVTILEAGGNPALTISRDMPEDSKGLDALFWQYASGDTGLELIDGLLRGSTASGVFSGIELAQSDTLSTYGAPFLLKRMNLDPSPVSAVRYADEVARAGILNTSGWHAINRPYAGLSPIVGWGRRDLSADPLAIPPGMTDVIAIDAGYGFSLALNSDGTVIGWGIDDAAIPPASLTDATAISAGQVHGLALKGNGTVVGWGGDSSGQAIPPVGLTGVTAVAAGFKHSLALKTDSTVVGWGTGTAATPPVGLTGVTALAAGNNTSVALKNDGTVIVWGSGPVIQPPADLTDVTAIAVTMNTSTLSHYFLALKNDGTLVGWGNNTTAAPPEGLTGITAISMGSQYGLALKSDGTVVGWGFNNDGQATPPSGLTGVTAIAAGFAHSLALKVKSP